MLQDIAYVRLDELGLFHKSSFKLANDIFWNNWGLFQQPIILTATNLDKRVGIFTTFSLDLQLYSYVSLEFVPAYTAVLVTLRKLCKVEEIL